MRTITLILALTFSIIHSFSCNASKQDGESSPYPAATSYISAANNAYAEGNYVSSLHYCHEFMRLAENNPENKKLESLRSQCYKLLGNIHFNFHDYTKALRYYNAGIEIAKRHNDRENQARFLNNLSMAACNIHDSVLSLKYMREADKMPLADRHLSRYLKLCRQGIYQRYFGDWQKAIAFLKAAYKETDAPNFNRSLRLTPISEMFQIYEQQQLYDSALNVLDLYSRLANQYNVVNMMVDAERGYMRLYSRIPGMHHKVSQHQDRYFSLRDSLLDTESFLRVNEQYEDEINQKAKKRIETLQIQVSKLEVILISLVILLSLSIAVYIWISTSRRMKKAYSIIFKSNREMLQKQSGRNIQPSHAENVSRPTDQDAGEPPVSPDPASDEDYSSEDPASQDQEERETDDTKRQRCGISQKAADDIADRITRVMESTEEWLDPDFSVASLATLVGVNSKYVSACINDKHGKNFRTYINEYRIQMALRRMSDTENYGQYTIGAIAESVGFRSSTNFIAAFRKITGVTPSTYLRIVQEEK